MYNAKAYSVASATSPFASTTIARRDPTERDVQIEILFCGICHSDLHMARNEWSSVMPTVYPCVPGHEIVGRVTRVGDAVTKFKVGDLAGVGCLVDSDGTCPECKAGFEQFCANQVLTYGFPDKHTRGITYGGYSDSVVVNEHFALHIPANLDLARSRTSAVCRHYHLLADASLGSNEGQEGWSRWSGRAWPHGHQVRSCAGSAHCRLHHFRQQKG